MFSHVFFAYPLTDASAINMAKDQRLLIDIMSKHAYLPTILITNKDTAFTSTNIANITQCLGSHYKVQIPNIRKSSENWSEHMLLSRLTSKWHVGKFSDIAIKTCRLQFQINTTNHAIIGCEPTRVFHGRIPYNILNCKLGKNPRSKLSLQLNLPKKFKIGQNSSKTKQSNILFTSISNVRSNMIAKQEQDSCFVLQPKTDHQGLKIPFREYRWE